MTGHLGFKLKTGIVYLSRKDFLRIKGIVVAKEDGRMERYFDRRVRFRELLISIVDIPELADFLEENKPRFESALRESEVPITAYINIHAPDYIETAGGLLSAGYIVTIDYGGNTAFILDPGIRHITRILNNTIYSDVLTSLGRCDITADVDFTSMAIRAIKSGMRVVFYGDQSNLEKGLDKDGGSFLYLSSVRKRIRDALMARADGSEYKIPAEADESVKKEVEYFRLGPLTEQPFMMLILQKEDTDPNYSYPVRWHEDDLFSFSKEKSQVK